MQWYCDVFCIRIWNPMKTKLRMIRHENQLSSKTANRVGHVGHFIQTKRRIFDHGKWPVDLLWPRIPSLFQWPFQHLPDHQSISSEMLGQTQSMFTFITQWALAWSWMGLDFPGVQTRTNCAQVGWARESPFKFLLAHQVAFSVPSIYQIPCIPSTQIFLRIILPLSLLWSVGFHKFLEI